MERTRGRHPRGRGGGGPVPGRRARRRGTARPRPAALDHGRRWYPACGHPRKGALMNIGPTELIIVLIIVLVLFGGAKLPSLARSLGQAQKEFKKGMEESKDDDEHPAK